MRVATGDIIDSFVPRRLPSENSAEELSKSKAHLAARMFRRDLTVSMVSVSQKNESLVVAFYAHSRTDSEGVTS